MASDDTAPGHSHRPVVLVYLTLADSGEVRGGPRSMLLTARHLARYEPVFVLNRDSTFADDIRAAGLRVHVLRTPRVLDGLRSASWPERLRRLIVTIRHDAELLALAREVGAEILHCQDPAEALTAGVAVRLTGRPVLLHLRDGPRLARLRLPNLLATLVASRSVCVSEETRDSQLRAAPASLRWWLDRRMRAIPNGVDLAALERVRSSTATKEGARDALGIGRHAWLLTIVGPLSPKKNQLELLERAAAGLLALGPEVDVCFVGSERFDADYAARCRRVASGLPSPSRVHFLGELPYDQMGGVYQATDVLLLPSVVEGLPRVALEAQAWGCPVVATRIPGNRGAIAEGVGGLFVDPDRMESFADVAGELRDPASRARLSENGRRYVREHFDVRAVTVRMERLYDELL